MRAPAAVVTTAALALAAATVAFAPAIAKPAPNTTSTTTTAAPTFSCRASLVRTEGFAIAQLNQEPTVANAQNDPCVSESNALIAPLNPLTVGPVTVRALYTQTKSHGAAGSEAQSGVADAVITLPDGTVIHGAALTSQAAAGCNNNGTANLTGSSNVLLLEINGQTKVVNVDQQQAFALPGGGQVVINQQQKSANEVTQRALRVEVPGVGTVTVAESRADVHGTCPNNNNNGGGGGHVPQCSDEIDNDGDGQIDFGHDPGCESWLDDSEADGSGAPECSDGVDNDGDGRTDFPADLGCVDGNDDDESDDTAECSDGLDNDRDGLRDYPADTGCKSPTDDDEAAGFMTGGGGYDEVDKKTANEDVVTPGSSLRFGEVLPCDLGDNPGPSLNVSWHDPGLVQQMKLDTLTTALCRNDPNISPGKPAAEFDSYYGEGTGTLRMKAGTSVPVTWNLVSVDRGEPGAPPVIGVDEFVIKVFVAGVQMYEGVGSLDEGNIQAHTPGSFRQKTTNNA